MIHLAAESHVDRSIDGPAEFLRTNIQGTFTLLGGRPRPLADPPRAGPLATASASCTSRRMRSTAPSVPAGYFTESTPVPAPNSPYSASKAAADHLVRAWRHTYGLPTLVTNCSNNYGPYQFPEKLIPLCILNALEGKPLPIYGRGENVRDWLYVEDHARRPAPGAGRGAGRRDVQHRRAERAEEPRRRPDPLHPPGRAGPRLPRGPARGPRRPTSATAPATTPATPSTPPSSSASWAGRPRESFETGLRKTVRWYLDHPEWCARVRSGAYRGERLGPGGGPMSRKGIILAGGSGTRLYPLTRVVSKQLLPDLRQADDLLPAGHADAGGHPRGPHHLHPGRPPAVRGPAGGRRPVGAAALAYAEQPRPDGLAQAFLIGRDFVGAGPRRAGPGGQPLPRPGAGPDPSSGAPSAQEHGRHRLRLPGQGPRALRRRRVRRRRPGDRPGGEAGAAEVVVCRHRAVLLRQPGAGHRPRPEALPARRAGDHRRQPRLPPARPVADGAAGPRDRLAGHRDARGAAAGLGVHPDRRAAAGAEGRLPGGDRLPDGLHRRRLARGGWPSRLQATTTGGISATSCSKRATRPS